MESMAQISQGVIDKIAGLSGHTSVKAGAGAWIDMDDGNALALTRDGVLLAGRTSLVKERMGDGWKMPPHGAGTNLGYAAEVINSKPVFALVMTMSPAARREVLAKHGQNFGTDLIKRHRAASFAIFHDGIGWTWVDSTKAGMESMAQISQGVIDILRAAQIAPRGFANVAIGGLESYRGTDKHIDELLRHKADLMKLVDTYVGDGKFKTQLDKDARTNKVTVRLSDRSVSYVLPLASVVPMAALGFFLERAEAQAPPMQIPAPPHSPAKRR